MKGLKQQALIGAKWSLIEKGVNLIFELIVGISLARILTPADFGTVAIITVIISFSTIFVNSGFSQSLIRDLNVQSKDFSTIFYFNLLVGLFAYCVIFTFSSCIASYYGDSEIGLYVKILALSILISSLALVQRVYLTREMNFKLLSKISVLSSVSSGVLALCFAYNGFGIWSLIAKTLSREVIQTALFWFNNTWKPSIFFNRIILNRHFRYGSNFLASAFISQLYNNILALTIGKIYDLQTLGYYNRSQLFSNAILENVGGVMTSVSFPALAKVQYEKKKFVIGVRMLLRQAFFVTGIIAIVLFFSAKIIMPTLLGAQWEKSGEYLQYLSLVGFFAVLNSILVNSISVTGNSRIYLNFQIGSLSLNVFSLFVGYFWGLESMLATLTMSYVLMYLIISYTFYRSFQYSLFNQLEDYRATLKVIIPVILTGIAFSSVDNSLYLTIIMILTQLTIVIVLSSLLKIEEYRIIRNIILGNSGS